MTDTQSLFEYRLNQAETTIEDAEKMLEAGRNRQETNKTPISYGDYLKGVVSLSVEEQLTLIKVLSSALKKTIINGRKKNSIMALEGLGADIWRDIDAQEYVKRERKSWD